MVVFASSTEIINALASSTGQMIDESLPMFYFYIALVFVFIILGLIGRGVWRALKVATGSKKF